MCCVVSLSCSWVFIHEKAYQVTDTGIESAVMTKVKGFGYHHDRVMDVADYVFPPQVCDQDVFNVCMSESISKVKSRNQ